MCSSSTAPARSWPFQATTIATTPSRRCSVSRFARSSLRQTARLMCRSRPIPRLVRTPCSSTPASSMGSLSRRPSRRWPPGWPRKAGARRRPPIACATGSSRANAIGARRFRSSIARPVGSCRCRTLICRWCCPRSRTTPRRAARRWLPPRSGAACRARPAALRPCARPTRWTRLSTPPGTTCATSRRTTTRRSSTRLRSTGGYRLASTSAASSTRSCICSTAGSLRRCCSTRALSASRSRLRTSLRRG